MISEGEASNIAGQVIPDFIKKLNFLKKSFLRGGNKDLVHHELLNVKQMYIEWYKTSEELSKLYGFEDKDNDEEGQKDWRNNEITTHNNRRNKSKVKKFDPDDYVLDPKYKERLDNLIANYKIKMIKSRSKRGFTIDPDPVYTAIDAD